MSQYMLLVYEAEVDPAEQAERAAGFPMWLELHRNPRGGAAGGRPAPGVVLFSTDPNFRAWTVGMQKMLRNAILGADGFAGAAASAGSSARADAERAAKNAAAKVAALESPLRLSVDTASVDPARAIATVTARATRCARREARRGS
jgi:hypothetical protein